MLRMLRCPALILVLLFANCLAWGQSPCADCKDVWTLDGYPPEGTFSSPIVIDLEGKNFDGAFTSLEDGIRWDFVGNGRPFQLAWTNPKRRIGFLVLDRPNKGYSVPAGTTPEPPNGLIDSGRELFGDITRQPLSDEDNAEIQHDIAAQAAKGLPPTHWQPNGFRALAFFDRPMYGGNNDGMISSADSIWPQLKVWVDTTHDGVSTHGKMYTLDELGVESISTKFVTSPRKDSHGNELRFQGTIQMARPTSTVPMIYDVFFISSN